MKEADKLDLSLRNDNSLFPSILEREEMYREGILLFLCLCCIPQRDKDWAPRLFINLALCSLLLAAAAADLVAYAAAAAAACGVC